VIRPLLIILLFTQFCQLPLKYTEVVRKEKHFITFNVHQDTIPKDKILKKLLTEKLKNSSDYKDKIDLSYIYALDMQLEKAEEILLDLVRIDKNTEAYLNLSRLYYIMNDYDKIKYAFRDLVAFDLEKEREKEHLEFLNVLKEFNNLFNLGKDEDFITESITEEKEKEKGKLEEEEDIETLDENGKPIRKKSYDAYIVTQEQKIQIQHILNVLKNKKRINERIIVLAELENVAGFERMAYDTLSEYYFKKRDFGPAAAYYEKILRAFPYDKKSLLAMTQISHENGNYRSCLLYGNSLLKNGTGKELQDIQYYLADSHFKLQRYKEALAVISKSSESSKTDYYFLVLWRDTLLVLNQADKISELKPYIYKLKENGVSIQEETFLFPLEKEGKELYSNILRGN